MSDPRRFVLTEEHLSLLRHAFVGWDDIEYGAPAIDPKRPYGNSSVALDIAEILGWEVAEDDELTQGQRDHARVLHEATRDALQIVLTTGSFEPGTYEADRYRLDWKRVES